MPLARLQDLLAAAQRDRYALCYCESWNLESLQAVLDAAEETGSPAIAGFNGGFLRHPARKTPEKLAFYAGFRLAIERACVPVAFLLNESADVAQMREALTLGFNALMPDNEGLHDEQYLHIVQEVVQFAHPLGAFVEAQLGHLASGRHDGSVTLTEPEAAKAFVQATGSDALAVSVGNVHILTEGKCRLDVAAIERIRNRVSVPLVLHGGTGISAEDLRSAIGAGIAKVNFGTGLKQAYLHTVASAIHRYRYPLSPHEFLGIGGDTDILLAGRRAVTAKVCELMDICGCSGRAG
jgi:ketose-bisphosphate aldolase